MSSDSRFRSWLIPRQRLDVDDEPQQLLLTDLAFKGGHDGVIAGRNLAARQQDRVADVLLIGNDGASVGKRNRLAKEPLEQRRTNLAADAMATAAAELAEQCAAFLGQRGPGLLLPQPSG